MACARCEQSYVEGRCALESSAAARIESPSSALTVRRARVRTAVLVSSGEFELRWEAVGACARDRHEENTQLARSAHCVTRRTLLFLCGNPTPGRLRTF